MSQTLGQWWKPTVPFRMQWLGASWLCWSSLSSVCSSSPSGAPSDRKVTSSLYKHLTRGDTLTCGTSPSEESEKVTDIKAEERESREDKGWFRLHQHQPGSITHPVCWCLVQSGPASIRIGKRTVVDAVIRLKCDSRNITVYTAVDSYQLSRTAHVTAMKKHWVMWKYKARFDLQYHRLFVIGKKCKVVLLFTVF